MKHLFILVFAWLSLSAHSQPSQKFAIEQLKEDFLIMKGGLEELHPGLYWYRSKVELDEAFAIAEAELNHPIDEHAYLRVLGSVITKIGCGHTQLRLSDSTYQYYVEQKNFFPLSIIMLNNKLYATQSVEESIDAGNEIININGLHADSLIETFRGSLWTEGLRYTKVDYEMGRYFNFLYPIFIGNANEYIIEYIDNNGTRKETVLDQDIKKSPPILDYDITDNIDFSFQSVHGGPIAVLDINHFFDWANNGKQYKFRKELRKVFEKIDSARTENLIIDLRDNGGGRAPYDLFSYLYDDRFTFFDRMEFIVDKDSRYDRYCNPKLSKLWITGQSKKSNQINDTTYHLKNEPMLKPQKPSNPQYIGDLYVLINGGTFSAASDLAALIKSNDLATFVGTETGGGYYGNTSMEDAWVTLPNTKVRVRIPLVRHFLPVEDKVPLGRGVIPDHEVEQSITDLINGVDTQMEFVLKLLTEKSP
ncbi:MAG: S41 family peptidase [Balneolaceae bacterium]